MLKPALVHVTKPPGQPTGRPHTGRSPHLADDLVLSSYSQEGMQALVTEAELDASREKITFSKKIRIMVISSKTSMIPCEVSLYDSKIQTSESEVHLSITRNWKGTNDETVMQRVKLARITCCSLMGAVLGRLNGTG